MECAASRLALRFAVGVATAASPSLRSVRTSGFDPDPRVRNATARAERAVAFLAGGEGFEPPLTESESVVLPLDDPPRERPELRAINAWSTGWPFWLYANRLSCVPRLARRV